MIKTTKAHEIVEELLLAIDEDTARISSFTEEVTDRGASELTLCIRRLPPKKRKKSTELLIGERLILQLYERSRTHPDEAEQAAEQLSLQLMGLVEKIRRQG